MSFRFYLFYLLQNIWNNRTPRQRRQRRTSSRSEALFEGVERFTKRTISTCVSTHEDDSDLPTVAETEAMLTEGIEEEEEDNSSFDGEKDREGEHTISYENMFLSIIIIITYNFDKF